MLKGKHIVLGISGGIAAYKTAILTRLLVKAGAEVQVIMTPNAKEFITPLTLSTLSGKPVISEFFTANTGEWHSHVDLGLWADAFVVAPATASTIAKMANGVADNMLITSYLSTRAQVFVAPAMDLDMMAHPTTTANIDKLRSFGNIIIEPTAGELASHLIGKGRMEEPEEIVAALTRFFAAQKEVQSNSCPKDLTNKTVMITLGPTREKIDPVRYISNYSTGKMGIALAEEAAKRGATVVAICGPIDQYPQNESIKTIKVESAAEMLDACNGEFTKCDIAIMCAAVADYTVEAPSPTKLKREGNDVPQIKLIKNPDISAELGKSKHKQILVGFALETNDEAANAQKKLQKKNLDMIVLNSLHDKGAGFATDTNKVTIFRRDGKATAYPLKSKKQVAKDIFDEICRLNRN